MQLVDLMRDYRDGEEHGWFTEFEWLRANDAEHLNALRADIAANGIRVPILLGNDGRIWDGHHRICAAYDLGLSDVPTTASLDEARN